MNSIEQKKIEDAAIAEVGAPLEMRQLAELLVKHYGLHEGLFNLVIEFKIGVGPVGKEPNTIPGATVGFAKVALARADSPGPATIDAAKVNPKVSKRRK